MFDLLELPPSIPFAPTPTACEELENLRRLLGCGARLMVKRDDAIAFAFGGNKVRRSASLPLMRKPPAPTR